MNFQENINVYLNGVIAFFSNQIDRFLILLKKNERNKRMKEHEKHLILCI